eukprot:CAMPEP_0113466524 /NCGR_PEP_ID=MMETSP0014_2-20120614/14315_1 /TAXON_ID=2857 /ORGANISM="Nitzschia sp." /LENGTH=198 /DNA_ID=CAMNT_0000358747 /DNA_START=65 /DNA_END=657 /DNA_ORIENTATION=+ /assembly_acc=CAM_ASM_000159
MSEEETKATTEAAEAPPAPAVAVAAASASATEDGKHVEEENTAHFEPVVQLEEIEVKTGEEEEEVLHSVRAKLFIYDETLLDQGTGNKTWKERGIGDAKILRHKEHQKSRILMRQEKTMKIIANHALDPRITLEPNVGSDRSWVWSAFDFAEGELKETVFALRFKDSDIANAFKEKFEAAQADMEKLLAGEDQPDTDG